MCECGLVRVVKAKSAFSFQERFRYNYLDSEYYYLPNIDQKRRKRK